ncbi:MAG TPA: tetratricopeptide repeat-containing glycosyltransferase family protein [Pirellulaceae bacterium]|jgi:tetratricopeptide (TPR) repeat protein
MPTTHDLYEAVRLHERGHFEEAEHLYRKILSLEPSNAAAWHLFGRLAMQFAQHEVAIQRIGRALTLKPDYAEAYNDVGLVYEAQKRFDAAIASFEHALALKPDYVGAINNLGNALRATGRVEQALKRFNEALLVEPSLPAIHNNLGLAQRELGNTEEAFHCFQRAISIDPCNAESFNNLGAVYRDLGQHTQAAECFTRALTLNPTYADAHFNRATHWLLHGDFAHGWKEYEWRWQRKDFPSRGAPELVWDGRTLSGHRLLLHAEQGLGDTIQFARYAALCKNRGATVVFAAQKPLVALLAGCPGIDELTDLECAAPPFHFHAPLMSLPNIFGTSLDAVPAKVPYLTPSPLLKQSWMQRLGAFDGIKIGIAWQGNASFVADRYRSIPLSEFAPLAAVSGVTLVSLQKGPGTEQLRDAKLPFSIVNFGDRLDASGAFADTAAIMTNLDLIVTSDSAIAHLAGALAIPTWLALPLSPDWRWLLSRADSPWYPTLRLFRQGKRGDWKAVFDEMANTLVNRLSK